MPATWIDDVLKSGRQLVDAGDGLLSVVDSGEHASPYDRHAVLYDHLAGSGLYNRLV